MIAEGTKFFHFMEDMVSKGQKTGNVKLKDGSKHKFEYITMETINDKKRYYIQIL